MTTSVKVASLVRKMDMASDDKWRIKVLETIIVLALFVILAGVFAGLQQLLWVGIALLILAVFVKSVAAQLASGWLWFSEKIAFVNSTIILTLLFYLLLTPIAVIYRWFNKDPLKLDMNDSGSFYAERNHVYNKSDLSKMW